MAVGGPRVRALHPTDRGRSRSLAPAHRPKAPSTCSQARPPTQVRDVGERVERTGVDVARLRAHDHRSPVAAQDLVERLRAHPPLVVAVGDIGAGCRARPTAGPAAPCVHLAADHDLDARRPLQAVRLDVPPGSREHRVAGGGERREVGHLRAGREPERRVLRQAEQVQQPTPATSSTAAAAGDITSRPATWSQATANQSAAIAASRVPPTTYPK